MQIDPDISPVISPKSNISNSFASQKDLFLLSLNSNRNFKQSSDNARFDIPGNKEDNRNRTALENQQNNINNQNNTITTNESYSVEKHSYLENPTADDPNNNSFNGLLIPEISTERELQNEEDPSRSQLQTLNILEYEEFNAIEEKESPLIKDSDDVIVNEKSNNQNLKAQEEKINITEEKIQDKTQEKTERTKSSKILVTEEANEQTQFSNLFGSDSQGEEISLQLPKKKDRGVNLKALNVSDESSGKKMKQSNLVDEKVSRNGPNISLSKETTSLQEEKNPVEAIKKVESPTVEEGQIEEENKSLAVEKKNQYKEENEIIAKENQRLKDEMRDVYKRLQEMNIENLKLKAEIKHQEENKVQAKARTTDEYLTSKSMSRDLKRENKELELKALIEENKMLSEKENRYKQAMKEKDGLINQLRVQYDEIARTNQNDLYVSLVEKMKISKEKMAQMSRQIEDQKDVIVSKENAIENLLSRMDELTNSLTSKTNEINSLKSELNAIKNENIKVNKEPKLDPKGSGSLYSKIKEKEKFIFSPEKRSENEQRVPSSHSQANSQNSSDRKGPRMSPGAFKSTFEDQKAYYRPLTRSEKNIDDQINKSSQWSSLKWNMLNQRDKMDKSAKEKDQHLNKKLKNRSIDNFIQSKNEYSSKQPEPKTESKKSNQNIEDLQKRLAYLKYKRMEFEKKKSSGQELKESGNSITDSKKQNLTDSGNFGFKTSLKNLDSLVSPTRNPTIGRYSEPLTHHDEDPKRRESYGKNSGMSTKSNYKDSMVYKSIQLNQDTEIEDAIKNLRTSLTSKPKLQPKLDNFVMNSTPNYQTEEDFKLGNRFHSFSNTSAAGQLSKNTVESTKNYKKSYDLSSYTKLAEVRSVTEASTKNKISGRDFFH